MDTTKKNPVYSRTDSSKVNMSDEEWRKVLPADVAKDPERLARFEREAKVLASLNHPNIAQIYGLEESANGRALVATRIKLADAQKVVVIAETSKGEFWNAHADVIVTIAACIEDIT